MKIASLVPSATEIVFALGLGDRLVAVTHECDWPPEAATLPHLTRTVVLEGLSPAEIDRTVRETVASGRPLYELDSARCDVAVVMPCGYGVEEAAAEAREYGDRIARLGAQRVVAVDASAYFSRPGPRLVMGIELLGHILHPERVALSPALSDGS